MTDIIGIVEEIGQTKYYPKKDGSGQVEITKLKINGKYYTSFAKIQLQDIKVGSQVDVTYTEKENFFDGKKYINNNISVIKPHVEISPELKAKIEAVAQTMQQTGTNATDPNFAQNVQKVEQQLKQQALKGENIINLGGKTIRVTLEEIN